MQNDNVAKPTTMNMTGAVSEVSLLAIFAEEAQLHLAHIDADLDALASCGAAARPALLASLLEASHTLAGAAGSVDLDDLAWLCRALEGVFRAAAGSAEAFDGGQFARLHEAVATARALTCTPDGRTRNQAMALIAWLDAMARQAAVPASA